MTNITSIEALDRAVTQSAKDREMWNSLDCTPAMADLVRAKLGAMGFVLVPAEPTEAIIDAGLAQGQGAAIGYIYRAMIEASQEGE